MGIKLSTEFIDKWNHIINEVDKTEIPANLIDKLVISLVPTDDGKIPKSHTISVPSLKEQGLTTEQIEDVINETLYELNDFIDSVDFFLDVEGVAKTVQPQTDNILKKMDS